MSRDSGARGDGSRAAAQEHGQSVGQLALGARTQGSNERQHGVVPAHRAPVSRFNLLSFVSQEKQTLHDYPHLGLYLH